jgi:hypothetical protein
VSDDPGISSNTSPDEIIGDGFQMMDECEMEELQGNNHSMYHTISHAIRIKSIRVTLAGRLVG